MNNIDHEYYLPYKNEENHTRIKSLLLKHFEPENKELFIHLENFIKENQDLFSIFYFDKIMSYSDGSKDLFFVSDYSTDEKIIMLADDYRVNVYLQTKNRKEITVFFATLFNLRFDYVKKDLIASFYNHFPEDPWK